MKGIPAGAHKIKVEMYELWSLGEKLSQTAKEVTVDYVPQTRADRLVKVPIVKSVAGTDLAAVSESEKNIYREIEATEKKELISKRDEY
jgi:D-aminopeptidase